MPEDTKNPGFCTFFEILGISLKIPSISNLRCEKPSISKFLIRNTRNFESENFEILGFSHLEFDIFRAKYPVF